METLGTIAGFVGLAVAVLGIVEIILKTDLEKEKRKTIKMELKKEMLLSRN